MINLRSITRSGRPRSGYSMFEVIFSSLLVGVVITGALELFGATSRTNRVAADKLDAPALAYGLMSEILSLPYEDPNSAGSVIGIEGSEMGMTRSSFNDVDDYEGWNRSPPEKKDGTMIETATGWTRGVSVRYFDPFSGTANSTDDGLKRIVVSVISPTGEIFELRSLRSRWGGLQQTPSVESDLVTSLEAELQIGSSSAAVTSSAYLNNHATDE